MLLEGTDHSLVRSGPVFYSVADPQELLVVDYAVRPGDEVTIRVFTSAGAPLEEVTGVRLVDPNGLLYLPYVGTLDVTGLTTIQIRERLERAYARLYDAPVVDVLSRVKVNITGSVRNPGH